MYRLTSKQDAQTVQEQAPATLQELAGDRSSVLGNIGNTPLLRLRRVVPAGTAVAVYAKAEWFNPGGSVKDRAALQMLLEAERAGMLTRDRTIVDATSGNTGIAYAMIGSALGYKVLLALPANASRERQQALRAYGADLMLTDPLAGTDGAQQRVREIVAAEPGRYFYPDQYNNAANWRAHYLTTGLEIWRQTEGQVTHFVAGLGTTGTFIGTARRLRDLRSSITCIAVEPDSPLHGLEGMKHLATAVVPGIFDPSVADERLAVSTEEAYAMVRRLAREEGLYVGVSSGAAMVASLHVASRLRSGLVVTVFPDGGARYGSERFWTDTEVRP